MVMPILLNFILQDLGNLTMSYYQEYKANLVRNQALFSGVQSSFVSGEPCTKPGAIFIRFRRTLYEKRCGY